MSTAEDQELRDKINKLASVFYNQQFVTVFDSYSLFFTDRINRHKEAQHSGANQGPDYLAGSRGPYHRSAPYPQQTYRGGRGRFAPTYRNRTLVLNGGPQYAASSLENQPPDSTTPTWVTKTDRHLQLINRDIYERESQQRTQAIEQSFKQKQLNKDRREKAQFFRNMQQAGGDSLIASSNPSKPASRYEVEVDGVRFHVTQQGSKLVKAPDDLNPANATPKVASLFGVKFHRTKNGNLVRHGIVQAQRNWLVKGDCPKGDNCDLSHDITEQRTPLCMHYANGNCNNPSCSYVHAEHSPTDPVCRTFGIYGYCEKGARCPARHVFECPDFSNSGICKLKGCKRPHIERASILRKANKQASSEEMDDLSSEDEDTADSDDVDSDEVEEFIGHNDDDLSFAEQKDFIGFT
ncbi:hypothetical protein FHL15_000244 [Xylaria flabelliformis]|uniref:C3H1-type domain-containing protein n=1 Tax=Xylaria flabelliformis TaxID=2512241 RepID=A0A553IFC0_9PEZI|nr:hypothetical protein FHL15_000244 [Xylaria flabelliformis]